MPSFDIVSEIDHHELSNAVDQANRELDNRFDFKGVDAKYVLEKDHILLRAPSDFQVQQMLPILQDKLIKRGLDIKVLDVQPLETNLSEARQKAVIREGISQENGKKMTKLIKDSKLKVQASIQGDQVRVAGKKRDELQSVMSLLKEQELDLALQFKNFRD